MIRIKIGYLILLSPITEIRTRWSRFSTTRSAMTENHRTPTSQACALGSIPKHLWCAKLHIRYRRRKIYNGAIAKRVASCAAPSQTLNDSLCMSRSFHLRSSPMRLSIAHHARSAHQLLLKSLWVTWCNAEGWILSVKFGVSRDSHTHNQSSTKLQSVEPT